MLRGEKPLSAVFPCFIDWLISTTKQVSDKTSTPHYPGKDFPQVHSILHNRANNTYHLITTVLVAHNGFSFDFPMLLAEVERCPENLSTSVFEHANVHFSDTLPLLRQVCRLTCMITTALHTIVQMKKDGHTHLTGTMLGMGALYLHTIGTSLEGNSFFHDRTVIVTIL